MILPKLMLGDNQFFGVNHMSEERARAQAMRFQDLQAIIDVLDIAHGEGVSTFMCTTHDRIGQICDHVRADPGRYEGFTFLPCMPYAHKYANAVTDSGMVGALRMFLPEGGMLGGALRGGGALARRDVETLSTLLIDAEMKMFHGLETPVIFLQNVIVDLFLGLGFTDAFRMFAEHVTTRYGAEPAFITMNLPMLLDALDSAGVENPIVCFNMNKLDFRMSGGLDAYLEALRTRQFRAVAMSVFASGAIAPREALEWVCTQPGIESIVFGASSRTSIRSTRDLVDEFWPSRTPA
jgi:hypothetical protein